jgi:hypothetical protein
MPSKVIREGSRFFKDEFERNQIQGWAVCGSEYSPD